MVLHISVWESRTLPKLIQPLHVSGGAFLFYRKHFTVLQFRTMFDPGIDRYGDGQQGGFIITH